MRAGELEVADIRDFGLVALARLRARPLSSPHLLLWPSGPAEPLNQPGPMPAAQVEPVSTAYAAKMIPPSTAT